MSSIRVTNAQGHPLEGVTIMVSDGPVSVPDMASISNSDGVGSLGHLSEPGRYTLTLQHGSQQVERQIQYEPGKNVSIVL